MNTIQFNIHVIGNITIIFNMFCVSLTTNNIHNTLSKQHVIRVITVGAIVCPLPLIPLESVSPIAYNT